MIQRKRVCKLRAFPGICGVALRTVIAELPTMHIILAVATGTVGGRAPKDVIDVTLFAFYLRVLSGEFEGGQVVIKDFGRPAFRVVAACTIGAKVGRVGVILLVAAGTVGWGIFESGQISHPLVALEATDAGMLAQQWISQEIVIEPVL